MKSSGSYSEEKWRTFIAGDSLEAVARGTWSTNEDDLPKHAGLRRYGAAKMCLVMMIGELQRRLDTDPVLKRISIVGFDPGSMSTGIVRRDVWASRIMMFRIIVPIFGWILAFFIPNPIFRTIRKSSADLLAAAFESDPRLRGKYLNGTELKEVQPEAADVKKRTMVWRDSIKYTQLTGTDTLLANWA